MFWTGVILCLIAAALFAWAESLNRQTRKDLDNAKRLNEATARGVEKTFAQIQAAQTLRDEAIAMVKRKG